MCTYLHVSVPVGIKEEVLFFHYIVTTLLKWSRGKRSNIQIFVVKLKEAARYNAETPVANKCDLLYKVKIQITTKIFIRIYIYH